MDLIFERGTKRRVKCPEAPTESWPADVRSELRQILPMHIIFAFTRTSNSDRTSERHALQCVTLHLPFYTHETSQSLSGRIFFLTPQLSDLPQGETAQKFEYPLAKLSSSPSTRTPSGAVASHQSSRASPRSPNICALYLPTIETALSTRRAPWKPVGSISSRTLLRSHVYPFSLCSLSPDTL